MWKRYITRSAALLACAVLVLYIGDYLLLKMRGDNGLGIVTVRRYYAVLQKNGRIEFLPADPQDRTCVRSLFPHMSSPPCWYLVRHSEQRIDM